MGILVIIKTKEENDIPLTHLLVNFRSYHFIQNAHMHTQVRVNIKLVMFVDQSQRG